MVQFQPLSEAVILYITGGAPNAEDIADANGMARRSGLTTAMLFDMPNQPLFDLEEDALIAYTFSQHLETGEADWPLLFPMTRSVLRAMDALSEWSEGRIKRFVLMGESKRAWTAWMAAATGDARIAGVVATVFDNLNLPAQMARQLDVWGRYSPEIHDYTDLGLQEKSDTSRGRVLSRMVDPYSYLRLVRARVLQVHGANDPYWLANAREAYAGALPEDALLLTLPNESHVFGDKTSYFESAGTFAAAVASKLQLPSINTKLVERNLFFVNLILSAEASASFTYCRLFIAESETANFSECHWEVESHFKPIGTHDFYLPLPESRSRYLAAFVQAEFDVTIGGTQRRLTVCGPTVMLDRDDA